MVALTIHDQAARLADTPATARNRQVVRQFLRVTPREDGTDRVLLESPTDAGRRFYATRAQLTRLIEANLTPRQRMICRLHIERDLSRREVCRRLCISLKTLERDMTTLLGALATTAYIEIQAARRARGL